MLILSVLTLNTNKVLASVNFSVNNEIPGNTIQTYTCDAGGTDIEIFEDVVVEGPVGIACGDTHDFSTYLSEVSPTYPVLFHLVEYPFKLPKLIL